MSSFQISRNRTMTSYTRFVHRTVNEEPSCAHIICHKSSDGCGAELGLHDVTIILDDSCGLLILLIDHDC